MDAVALPEEPDQREKERRRRIQAVAGRERLARAIPTVLRALGHQLAGLTLGVPVDVGNEPRVARFLARECPVMRLVTGLCQGADLLVGRLLENVRIIPDSGALCQPDTRCLKTELAAVLPFDVETYRRSRPASSHSEFDRQLQSCEWVIALDGIYEKPSPDTPAASNRRKRAYRAQSAFLLRQSDIFIAAADPDGDNLAGGTLESVREALAFDLPVIFIHTGREGDNIFLIDPDEDPYSVLAGLPPTAEEWKNKLRQWVSQLLVDPDREINPGGHWLEQGLEQGDSLLREFFDEPNSPPLDSAGKRKVGNRERAWTWFEKKFRTGPNFQSDPKLEPFSAYRRRATDLNYHYSGQYRGAFLLNYVAAIMAVALAAASLTLLGVVGNSSMGEAVVQLNDAAGHPPEAAPGHAPVVWLLPVLLILATIKLVIVGFIWRNTRHANLQRWNDRAVDYRYLAERLRAMLYLPLAGSHQPPAALPPQYTSRVVRQSAMDWLFDSLVRAVSPAEMPHAFPCKYQATEEHGELTVKKLLTLEPKKTAETVRDRLITEQAKYHDRNARTMHALHLFIEEVSSMLAWIVIAVVVIDVLVLGAEVLHLLPEAWVPIAKGATPWLIFVSAVLPAMVAALSGMRFQSECRRLAERSAVMRTVLAGRDPHSASSSKTPWWRQMLHRLMHFVHLVWIVPCRLVGYVASPTQFHIYGGRQHLADTVAQRILADSPNSTEDQGCWSLDVLHLTERITKDFVQEAAEWSVLYAKEVSDPG